MQWLGTWDHFLDAVHVLNISLTLTKNGTLVEKKVQTAADNVLFLWEMHNRVNIRLRRDESRTNDPAYPKMVFPDVEHCKVCYNHPERVPKNDSYKAQQQILKSNDFNRKEVLKFLVKHFSNVETNEEDKIEWKNAIDGQNEINLSMHVSFRGTE